MGIFIGGTEITDIKIGSTDINSVWIGATKIWERLSLYTSPANGYDFAIAGQPDVAQAQVSVVANVAVTWTFNVVSSSIAVGGTLSYGSTSGLGTYVRMTQSQIGTSIATVDVTAPVGTSSVTVRVQVDAPQANFGG